MSYTKIGLMLDNGGIIELGYDSKDEKDIMKSLRDQMNKSDCLWVPVNWGGEAFYHGIEMLHINTKRIIGTCNY